jgi:hypothetical protein
MLNKMFQTFSIKADKFNARASWGHCTVLITDIEDRFMTRGNLTKFLNGIYPGEVRYVDFCRDLNGVQRLWMKFKKAEKQRELCEKARSKKLGFCCCKKNLDHFKEIERDMKKTFYEKKLSKMPTLPVAVVQFASVKAATICASTVLVSGGRSMKVRTVPEYPDQILWKNLSQKGCKRQLRVIAGRTLYILLIIFYSLIVVFIQGLANLDNLASVWSEFAEVLEISPEAVALIQGSLPAIILSFFFMVLPKNLACLSSMCKMPFKTDEDSLTSGRYADCLVGMGLVVSIFASGIFSSLDAIENISSEDVWTSLGNEVPAQSIFFVTYVITTCFINIALDLAMVIPFLKNLFCFYSPQTFAYGSVHAVNIFMFTICMTYAVVSPIILVWGCLYFLIAYFTYTYQLLFIFERSNDTGGSRFPSVFGRLCNGMIIGQIVIILMLVLVKSMVLAGLFVLIPFYTLYMKSEAKKYAYYFGRTSAGTAQEDFDSSRNILVQARNNFVAPPVKALQFKSRDWNKGSEDSGRKSKPQKSGRLLSSRVRNSAPEDSGRKSKSRKRSVRKKRAEKKATKRKSRRSRSDKHNIELESVGKKDRSSASTNKVEYGSSMCYEV